MKIRSITRLMLLLSIPLFQGCISFLSTNVLTQTDYQYDEVKGLYRVQKVLHHIIPEERSTAYRGLCQTFLLEKGKGANKLSVFDELTLSSFNHELEDSVYYILGNKIYALSFDELKLDTQSSTTGSTKVKVVDEKKIESETSYDENINYTYTAQYQLPAELIQQLQYNDTLKIRYYLGPYMMTFKIKGSRYKKFVEGLYH